MARGASDIYGATYLNPASAAAAFDARKWHPVSAMELAFCQAALACPAMGTHLLTASIRRRTVEALPFLVLKLNDAVCSVEPVW